MLAFKLNLSNRHTCSSVFLGNNFPLCYFLLQPPWYYHNTVAEELIYPPQLGLSCTVNKSITCSENHLLSPARLSEERNLSKYIKMDLASCKGIISNFTSSMLQHLHVPLPCCWGSNRCGKDVASYSGMVL